MDVCLFFQEFVFGLPCTTKRSGLYQEPMRAEGPKERPTAVLCVQLSARYVQIRQTAKIPNSEILRPSGYYNTTF